jgi:hypothetical protein
MIRRLAGAVQVSCPCEELTSEFVYSIKLTYGRRARTVVPRTVPLDPEPVRILLQSWTETLIARDELLKKRHLADLGLYFPGNNLAVRLRRTKELDDQRLANLSELHLRLQRTREALEWPLESIPLESPWMLM